jgi:hypothetical protein
LIEKV